MVVGDGIRFERILKMIILLKFFRFIILLLHFKNFISLMTHVFLEFSNLDFPVVHEALGMFIFEM